MNAIDISSGGARRVVTSGFTAVDVIVNGAVAASPGGTAVNVASILRRLGWDTQIVGTVGDDPAGELLVDTLKSERVGTSHLRRFADWTTPVVVQERYNNDHVWRFSCPVCGARLAKHRPSESAYADVLLQEVQVPQVFFFDRVSLFTLKLAAAWKDAGSTVVFEPAGLGRPALFERAIGLADVIKFSSERAPAFVDRLVGVGATLIETLGEEGARVRAGDSWLLVPSRRIKKLVDSAGAGDWTTAGIIDTMYQASARVDWSEALAVGQKLGAQACGWEGVRPEVAKVVGRDFEQFGCPRVAGVARFGKEARS